MFKCPKLGHFKNISLNWNKEAYYAKLIEDQTMLLMIHAEFQENDKDDTLLLHFGCSNHMSGNKIWFIKLDETFNQVMKLGNNSRMQVVRKGNVKLKLNGVP